MSSEVRCQELLDQLLKPGTPSPELARHLKECPECASIFSMVGEMRAKPSIYPETPLSSLHSKVIAACAAALPKKVAVAKGISGIYKLLISISIAGTIAAGAYFAARFSHPGVPLPPLDPVKISEGVTASATVGNLSPASGQAVPIGRASEPTHLIHASDD